MRYFQIMFTEKNRENAASRENKEKQVDGFFERKKS